MVQLHDTLRIGEICIFFRNSHFSTMYKHSDGHLYNLVTDLGFVQYPHICWERLLTVDGDDQYCDHEFKTLSNDARQTRSLSPWRASPSQIVQRANTVGPSTLSPHQPIVPVRTTGSFYHKEKPSKGILGMLGFKSQRSSQEHSTPGSASRRGSHTKSKKNGCSQM
eukprot:Lankesteria_metandrocarpae@DN9774_c0_g1_i1.p1